MMALISTGKAAKLAGVTRQTIRNYVADGKLSASKTPGGALRLEESEVRAKLCKKPQKLDDILE